MTVIAILHQLRPDSSSDLPLRTIGSVATRRLSVRIRRHYFPIARDSGSELSLEAPTANQQPLLLTKEPPSLCHVVRFIVHRTLASDAGSVKLEIKVLVNT